MLFSFLWANKADRKSMQKRYQRSVTELSRFYHNRVEGLSQDLLQ